MKLYSSSLIAVALSAPLILGQCDTGVERAEQHYQTGVELAEAGDIDRALVEFRNVFRLDGHHRDARATYAKLVRERGSLREAYGQYLRLVEQYPEDLEGRIALGEMALESGNWEEVERHVSVAREIAPDDPLVQALVASMDYRKALVEQDPERRAEAAEFAQASLEEAETSDSARIITRRIVINELLTSDDPQAALPEIERALEQDPDSLEYNELKLRLLIAREDITAATAHFEEMYERFPNNEALRQNLIQWYLAQGELVLAENFLRRLAEESDGPDAAVTVVQFLYQTQGIDAAMAELERRIVSGQHMETFRAARAVLNVEQGNVEEGTRELEAIVEGATPSPRINDIRVILARLYERGGNIVGAQAQVASILNADPSHVEALKMQASWQIAADRPADAITNLRRALDQAPRDVGALTLLAQAHERMGDRELMGDRLALAMEASGQAPAETLRYARFLISEDRLTTARAALANSVRLHPQNIDLVHLLGQVHIELEEWERADAIIQNLQQSGSDIGRAAANDLQNRLLVAQGRTDDSIAFLQELIQNGEADVRTAALIVQGHLNAGRVDEAESYLEEQLATNPEHPALRFLRAGLSAARGDHDTARDQFSALVEEYPTDEAPIRALYQLELQTRNPEAAAAVLEAGLEANPNSAFLNWLRAGNLERAGDYEGAIEIYDRLYEMNRENLVIVNNLASLITTHRDDEESLARAYAIAQRLRGLNTPEFQDTYGWIAYRRGQYAEALTHLEPAAASLSNNALVQYHLGMTYLALERPEEARATLERALELAGESDLSQFERAREALAGLE